MLRNYEIFQKTLTWALSLFSDLHTNLTAKRLNFEIHKINHFQMWTLRSISFIIEWNFFWNISKSLNRFYKEKIVLFSKIYIIFLNRLRCSAFFKLFVLFAHYHYCDYIEANSIHSFLILCALTKHKNVLLENWKILSLGTGNNLERIFASIFPNVVLFLKELTNSWSCFFLFSAD